MSDQTLTVETEASIDSIPASPDACACDSPGFAVLAEAASPDGHACDSPGLAALAEAAPGEACATSAGPCAEPLAPPSDDAPVAKKPRRSTDGVRTHASLDRARLRDKSSAFAFLYALLA